MCSSDLRVVLGGRESETRGDDALDPVGENEVSARWSGHCGRSGARRVVGQVKEEGDPVETAVLLKVLTEEAGSLHVDSHRGEHDREVVLVAVVDALGRRRLGVPVGRDLVDETSLATDLRGNLQTRTVGVSSGSASATGGERTSLWGSPAAEKMGIFCPRAILFIVSIVEIPVWIISSG